MLSRLFGFFSGAPAAPVVPPPPLDIHSALEVAALGVTIPANYNDFQCTISYLMMFDPVTTDCGCLPGAANPPAYERSEIQQWMTNYNNSCPCCRAPIAALNDHVALRGQITQFLQSARLNLRRLRGLGAEDQALCNQLIVEIRSFLEQGNPPALLTERFKRAVRRILEPMEDSVYHGSAAATEVTHAASPSGW